jgi:hypothetical protein
VRAISGSASAPRCTSRGRIRSDAAPPANPITGAPPTSSPTLPPKVDGEIQDGKSITFGDLKVPPIALPGHTPGTMGFIFPVKDRGTIRLRRCSVACIAPQLVSDDGPKLPCLGEEVRERDTRARVDAVLVNHLDAAAAATADRSRCARTRPEPSSSDAGYQDFLGVLEGCTRVNIARRRQ